MKVQLLLIALLVFLLVGDFANAEEQIVFIGHPSRLTVVTDAQSESKNLNSTESEETLVLIVKVNGEYYWKSRENRPLDYKPAGAFHVFTSSSGQIKILETRLIEAMLPEDHGFAPYMYFETMSSLLNVYVYHGSGHSLNP